MANTVEQKSTSGADIVDLGAEREKRKSTEADAAFMDLMGDLKTMYRGQELNVHLLKPEDVDRIFGLVQMMVSRKEGAVRDEISGADKDEIDVAQIIKQGDGAREAVIDSAAGIKGLSEVLRFFLKFSRPDALTNAKGMDLVVVDTKDSAFIQDKFESELKGPVLNRTPDNTDTTNEGNAAMFMVTMEVGKEFQGIMERNGHTVVDLPSGHGFQAEFNGVRMAFLYADGQGITVNKSKQGEKAENKYGANESAEKEPAEQMKAAA